MFGHAGYPRARVVGGGVDTRRFSPDASVVRDGGPLFVGRLLPHKGVDDLIRGVPADLPLTIVAPHHEPAVHRELTPLAAGKRVRFRHDLSDDALVREYRRALCVVLPSVYRIGGWRDEGARSCWGRRCSKAWPAARPRCARDVASMPEVVEDGVTGFVVPPNDPARSANGCAGCTGIVPRREAMGRAGRRRVLAQFTWPLVVERCLDAYKGASVADPVAVAVAR